MRKSQRTKLYRWRWTGLGPNGRKMAGEMIAPKRVEVEKILEGQSIAIKNIRRKSAIGGGMGSIKPKDIMLFARQMATMIRAGVPVLQAFQVVAESLKKPAMSALVQELMNDVAAGASFSEALRRHPQQFDRLFASLVEAGEQSGSLDRMLKRDAASKEKME